MPFSLTLPPFFFLFFSSLPPSYPPSLFPSLSLSLLSLSRGARAKADKSAERSNGSTSWSELHTSELSPSVLSFVHTPILLCPQNFIRPFLFHRMRCSMYKCSWELLEVRHMSWCFFFLLTFLFLFCPPFFTCSLTHSFTPSHPLYTLHVHVRI